MRNLLLCALLLLGKPLLAQTNQPTFQYVNVIPNGPCVGTPPIQIMYLTGIAYSCNNGTWGNFAGGGGGGGTPTGPATGVLSGFYPAPGLAATGALPNGWTATTQTVGDTSTQVASDAFVAAAFGAPPPIGNVTPNTGAFTGITVAGAGPGVIQPSAFSNAGTPLSSLPCNSTTVNSEAIVSDALTPSSMGTYTSGGAITAPVVCSYNGTTYAWLTVGGASPGTTLIFSPMQLVRGKIVLLNKLIVLD